MAKALIIDDEMDICFLLSNIIRSKKLQASYVNSLADALPVLERLQPDMIFLDNHLPDGLGVDFIKQIKEFYPKMKVVMITAYDNLSERTKAFNNGADIFITKPFNKEIISQTVDKLLRNGST